MSIWVRDLLFGLQERSEVLSYLLTQDLSEFSKSGQIPRLLKTLATSFFENLQHSTIDVDNQSIYRFLGQIIIQIVDKADKPQDINF